MSGRADDLRATLERAVGRLSDVLRQEKTEYMRDSAIQRFEFTYELVWKTLKAFLSVDGVEAVSPKASLREAFRLGWIEDDPLWLETIVLRNQTSHTYNEGVAERIYAALPAVLRLYEGLLTTLTRRETK